MAAYERSDRRIDWQEVNRVRQLLTPVLLWSIVALGLWVLARYGLSVLYPT